MTPDRAKAFDFAQESTKQILSLSTAVLAVTITFLTDVTGEVPENGVPFLKAAWGLYLVSVVLGLLTLMGLTGALERQEANKEPSIYGGGIRWFSIGQVFTFAAALVATIVFGLQAF